MIMVESAQKLYSPLRSSRVVRELVFASEENTFPALTMLRQGGKDNVISYMITRWIFFVLLIFLEFLFAFLLTRAARLRRVYVTSPLFSVNYYARNDPLVKLDRRAAELMKLTNDTEFQEVFIAYV